VDEGVPNKNRAEKKKITPVRGGGGAQNERSAQNGAEVGVGGILSSDSRGGRDQTA